MAGFFKKSWRIWLIATTSLVSLTAITFLVTSCQSNQEAQSFIKKYPYSHAWFAPQTVFKNPFTQTWQVATQKADINVYEDMINQFINSHGYHLQTAGEQKKDVNDIIDEINVLETKRQQNQYTGSDLLRLEKLKTNKDLIIYIGLNLEHRPLINSAELKSFLTLYKTYTTLLITKLDAELAQSIKEIQAQTVQKNHDLDQQSQYIRDPNERALFIQNQTNQNRDVENLTINNVKKHFMQIAEIYKHRLQVLETSYTKYWKIF
ncbi:hypothetical protein [Ureaplasma zalophigenitalium]|uniref:Lipoprotein n=1 Tax=Ureaplasma zalophigenitalium TaxID=907723 RepID=A0ABT3BPZ2_9BACT|nr:hypothetical protein [Ureaplasma zalophigenitalium]MCV3754330.1 hypothetical protein [Ureaplasma zalophigenitalium]